MIGASQVVGLTSSGATVVDSLVLVARTTTASESFTISCQNVGVFDALIDWGDGSTSAITTYNDADLAHTFAVADDHTITITGSFPNLYFNNSASASKVIAAFLNGGQTFSTMERGFYGCSLTSFDASASGLASITNGNYAWSDNNLTSFDASGLTSITAGAFAWRDNNLTSFDASWLTSITSCAYAWQNNSLTSFDASGLTSIKNCVFAWQNNSLTSFDASGLTSITTCAYAWSDNNLTSFDASGFATMGIPASSCFVSAWVGGANALDAASVESILTNIDASGRLAPAVGPDITISSDGDPLTSSAATAVTSLKTKSWTITINGVAQ